MIDRLLDLSALRFLIVDDSAEMRGLLTHMLNSLGARLFLEANDASEALEMLKVNHVDVIFTDWKMEPVDGIVFTRLVRTAPDSQFQMTPIIMISGYTEMHHVSEARNAGVTEFLAKPVSAQALYRRIEEVILRPRQFVRTETFTGPDRHRRSSKTYTGPRRRKEDTEE
jgi:two-component system chemotaxis response regulator CheY